MSGERFPGFGYYSASDSSLQRSSWTCLSVLLSYPTARRRGKANLYAEADRTACAAVHVQTLDTDRYRGESGTGYNYVTDRTG